MNFKGSMATLAAMMASINKATFNAASTKPARRSPYQKSYKSREAGPGSPSGTKLGRSLRRRRENRHFWFKMGLYKDVK